MFGSRRVVRRVFVRRFHFGRVVGRADIAVAVAVLVVLVFVGVLVAVDRLNEDPCADGLRSGGGECVGVVDATAESPSFAPGDDGPDDRIADLVRSVARENEEVRDSWESPATGNEVPYVRVALMLPFTGTNSSAMSPELIEHALAGAHTEQLRANAASSGMNFQLLLANVGRDLSQWGPAVEQLAGMTGGEKPVLGDSPLIGVIGLPNSEQDTKDAAKALAAEKIPAISGVLSSPGMRSETLFKVSPSNTHFVEALEAYLEEKPGKEGWLVYDQRKEDGFVTDTQEKMRRTFGEAYELSNRTSPFVGGMGEYKGMERRFTSIAQTICEREVDTVFYAGRDGDLPFLITQLAREAACADNDPTIRILRVTTGLDSGLAKDSVRTAMKTAGVVTVSAAATDAPAWRAGQHEPAGFPAFIEELKEHTGLQGAALDDGYAIMHHDAFLVLTEAVDTAKRDLDAMAAGEGEGGENRLPSKEDVYNSIVSMKMVPGGDSPCQDCVRGASGMFGFDVQKENWPVCKPVPVMIYPAADDTPRPRVYRTYQATDGTCPS